MGSGQRSAKKQSPQVFKQEKVSWYVTAGTNHVKWFKVIYNFKSANF